MKHPLLYEGEELDLDAFNARKKTHGRIKPIMGEFVRGIVYLRGVETVVTAIVYEVSERGIAYFSTSRLVLGGTSSVGFCDCKFLDLQDWVPLDCIKTASRLALDRLKERLDRGGGAA